jgi:hypothetical protein
MRCVTQQRSFSSHARMLESQESSFLERESAAVPLVIQNSAVVPADAIRNATDERFEKPAPRLRSVTDDRSTTIFNLGQEF